MRIEAPGTLVGIGRSTMWPWVGNWLRSSTVKMNREARPRHWDPLVPQVLEEQVLVLESSLLVQLLDLHSQEGRST